MKAARVSMLRFFALLFVFTGLAGLIVSAMISTRYLDTLPQSPAPDEMRMTPRAIHGMVVYQTVEEDRKLSLIEYSSACILLVGFGLGLVYLEKWGSVRSREAEQDDEPKLTLN
jgi:hypothetical protein